ncbi:TPA: hypothetical protein OT044_004400 [Citrobacter koseri]|uniref:hypothetical protein n=1 Tax=Enterobacteriaceae TaxID=543 RepID=UPI000F67C590|nr:MULTISPECIES: hypothetical protein [Enterobacteriaceae]EDV4867838.1 hypothetical protein [Salmonella enterica subsp. enterica]HBR0978225.1 hypothetical protein [Klebsiella variicola]HCT5370181.1 hypothetical protein [Citrobacter koseri]HDG9833905.1 hypothetical protein [Raoultella ornithinolytica]HDT0661648.1 hypothetical protein [Enterobacter cloacae subsp. dissolvens]HDX4010762.1 hypothetical protein [Enterobacter asburiae]HDZ2202485.1 hypothetical protein [Klebsiella pneumoniae]
MSGKNPFWNYDYNAAQRNREIVDSYQQANEARLDSQQSQFEASMANDRVSRIQMQLNNTINSHKKVVADYEQRLQKTKTVAFKLAIRSNIFKRTLVKLTEEWPEKKDHILDEIQRQKNHCTTQEYRDNWWGWVSQNDPSSDNSYLDFPFPDRELKHKP